MSNIAKMEVGSKIEDCELSAF